MAICPAGHETSAHDFCDTCGLPVEAASQVAAGESAPVEAPSAPQPVICPHCNTPNVADALFCEACGYDFTTGSLPETPVVEAPVGDAPAEAAAGEVPAAAEPEVLAALAAPPQEPASPAATPAEEAAVAAPAPLQRPVVDWVAELWIDPDWYAAQGSSDPMPSPSLPDIAPLIKENNLIGRVSHSRGIFPDVDCELDSGCSRRHAMLSTDGSRWWIEDLDSANGTFVGAAAGPLPAMPIPQGRVELNPGQRIYVGAWTRIVVRKATEDEKVAFAG